MKANIDQKRINKIAKKYDLELLLLFGSQVDKNIAKLPDSDVDIAYQAKSELSGKDMINLNCDLIDLFDNDRVDMVNLEKANPLLSYQIYKKNKLLYGDSQKYRDFQLKAFKKYIDAHSLFELESKLVQKRQDMLERTIYG